MKLDLTSLIQLAASGNSKTVEEGWMAALETHAADPTEVVAWSPLLEELVRLERGAEAESLAWAALEAVREAGGVPAALKLAGPFLLAVGQSNELRSQVAALYAAAYAERENLAELLTEAGIAGGRPVRRALRTLDVCLNIAPDSYLIARHEHVPAHVEAIDPETWHVTIRTPEGSRTLAPVALADEYAPAEADDFRVLKHYAPDRLRTLLDENPTAVLLSIVRAHDGRLDSTTLADLLVPNPIPQAEWTKWWSKARAALKQHPNIQITGRSPYEITYQAEAVSLEAETETQFKRLHDPVDQWACLEAYVRACRAANTAPDTDLLARLKKRLDQMAQRQIKTHVHAALTALLVSRNIAEAMGRSEAEADRPVVEFLAAAAHPLDWLKAVVSDTLWPAACRCLQAAHPGRYLEYCAALLPEAPTGACDLLAGALLAGGVEREQIESLVQRILSEPVRHVDALAWLWRGPTVDLNVPLPSLPALCAKVLGVVAEMRRRDELPRPEKKRIQDRVRDCLSAGQYARFKACLADTDAGVASTWRRQLARFDNLGRAVPEDLIKLIHAAFPAEQRTAEVSPWKREDVLYMTAHGRQRLSGEVDNLVNVKMRANAKAIGDAAAHGDLSENSEYKFALEERDLLRARLGKLQGQLAQAVVLEAADVPEDHVGFGARVTLRSIANGQVTQMTFFGPWEADADRAVYNYRSPVGQKLMGLVPGDTVTLDVADHPGAYTVERIENALLPDAAVPAAT